MITKRVKERILRAELQHLKEIEEFFWDEDSDCPVCREYNKGGRHCLSPYHSSDCPAKERCIKFIDINDTLFSFISKAKLDIRTELGISPLGNEDPKQHTVVGTHDE